MNRVDFLSGVERAEKEGRIVYGSTHSVDMHGALPPEGSVNHFNIRSLDDDAAHLLSATRGLGKQRVLILGSGTGGEGYAVQQILSDAEVDGVALSPCNPYARVTLSSLEIHRQISALMSPDALHARRMQTTYGRMHEMQRQEYLHMPDDEYEQAKKCVIGSEPRLDTGTHVPTSLVEELHNEGKISAFDPITVPSIHRQYIGHFPDEVSLEDRYDFIYDSSGPLYYVDMEKRGTEMDPFVQTYDLLSERGMLYVTQFWPANRAAKVRQVLSQKSDSAALFLQGSDTRFVVIQPNCPLYAQVRAAVQEGNYESEGGVIQLRKDTKVFFQSIRATEDSA